MRELLEHIKAALDTGSRILPESVYHTRINNLLEQRPNITMRQTTFTTNYDDIVTMGHVLAATVFSDSEDPTKDILGYFEKPWKWENEYQQWREFGGVLDSDCLRQFADWYDAGQDRG